jgi:hypothetical protein
MPRGHALGALLGGAVFVGCAYGSSNGGSFGPGGDEGSASGNASSGGPAASAGVASSVATGDSSGGSAGTSSSGSAGTSSGGSAGTSSGGSAGTGSGGLGASASGSGSQSGTALPSGQVAAAGASTGSAVGADDAGSASSGVGGGTPTGDGGSPCQSGPLYPISATASSVADPADASGATFVAQNAIDNNLATRWESTFRIDPSTMTLDFGFPVHIGELDIMWHSDCPSAYDIDISSDGVSFTTLKSLTANPPSSQAAPMAWMNGDFEKISTVARFVRIHGTRRAQSQFGYSIWELRALGDRDASCAP